MLSVVFSPRVIVAEKLLSTNYSGMNSLKQTVTEWKPAEFKVMFDGCAANIWDGAGLFAVSLLPLPAWRCSALPFFASNIQ